MGYACSELSISGAVEHVLLGDAHFRFNMGPQVVP